MSKRVPTIEVLSAARETISRAQRWCRYDGAQTSDGCSVASDHPRAVRFCVLGAIGRAAAEAGLMPKDFDRNRNTWPQGKDVFDGQGALIASLNRLSATLFAERDIDLRLQDVNDRLGRKAAIRVLDSAIAELRSGAAW